MSNGIWVGIDVAKDSFHVSVAEPDVRPDEWAALPQASFEHSRKGMRDFISWLKKLGYTKQNVTGICIEATGRYSDQWVDLLDERLVPVSIVNPSRPVAYAKSLGIRDKSDRVDACVLALYGRTTQPRPTTRPSQTRRELRELSRIYQTLQADRQAYQRRLDSGLTCVPARKAIRQTIKALTQQIDTIEAQMRQLIKTDEVLHQDFKRAQTIKGVGPKTATVVLAEFGDLRDYKRDELVALAGLYPREHTSGRSVRKKSRLIKTGKAIVRAHLYMCAMNAYKHDPALRAFAQRLEARGKVQMQILAAVMRKILLIIRAVIVTQKDYQPDFINRTI